MEISPELKDIYVANGLSIERIKMDTPIEDWVYMEIFSKPDIQSGDKNGRTNGIILNRFNSLLIAHKLIELAMEIEVTTDDTNPTGESESTTSDIFTIPFLIEPEF